MELNERFTPVLQDPLIPLCRRCVDAAVVWHDEEPLCFEHAYREALLQEMKAAR